MGTLANILSKMYSASKSAGNAVTVEFKNLEKLESSKKTILTSVGLAMIPLIKSELQVSWARSGLKSKTGLLKSMAIDGAFIIVSPRGFKVQFASNVKSPSGTPVYEYGAALNYGALHGPGGEKLKRTLKRAAKNGHTQAGYKFVSAKEFYKFEPDQVRRLQLAYVALWQEKTDKIMGKAS